MVVKFIISKLFSHTFYLKRARPATYIYIFIGSKVILKIKPIFLLSNCHLWNFLLYYNIVKAEKCLSSFKIQRRLNLDFRLYSYIRVLPVLLFGLENYVFKYNVSANIRNEFLRQLVFHSKALTPQYWSLSLCILIHQLCLGPHHAFRSYVGMLIYCQLNV